MRIIKNILTWFLGIVCAILYYFAPVWIIMIIGYTVNFFHDIPLYWEKGKYYELYAKSSIYIYFIFLILYLYIWYQQKETNERVKSIKLQIQTKYRNLIKKKDADYKSLEESLLKEYKQKYGNIREEDVKKSLYSSVQFSEYYNLKRELKNSMQLTESLEIMENSEKQWNNSFEFKLLNYTMYILIFSVLYSIMAIVHSSSIKEVMSILCSDVIAILLCVIIRMNDVIQQYKEKIDLKTNLQKKYGDELLQKYKELKYKAHSLAQLCDKDWYNLNLKERIINETLRISVPFNYVAALYADMKCCLYRKEEDYLRYKSHPAKSAADIVRDLKEKTRNAIEDYKVIQYKYDFLLKQFPELDKYVEDSETINEVIKYASLHDALNNYDKAKDYLSREEYLEMTIDERNQLALDRYLNRKKSNWQIGRDYEMYIGYLYRTEGWNVKQYGIEKKLEDMGRDIIAWKKTDFFNDEYEFRIIQCKRWSKEKELHENVICQLYGTTVQFILSSPNKIKAQAILVTTTPLSQTAEKFAKYLGIKVRIILPKEFPRIKCNISKNGEKIYHLPFDQQYDTTKIINKGEFYAWNVKEATDAGFRRAFRYMGLN